MNTVICPRCGATSPQDAAFCGVCGAPLSAQQAASVEAGPPPGAWQPPVAPPPPMDFQAPPGGFPPPPPGGYPPPPPGVYPPPFPAAQIVGDNTKWAIGLGIAGLFCCGPFTAIPGIFMAKKDMDESASGRAPQLNAGWAKGAFYLNIVAIALYVLILCAGWSLRGLRSF